MITKHRLKISFENRDKLAELMAIVNPKVTVDTVNYLCYGKRENGTEYIQHSKLIDWFNKHGVKVKDKDIYSPCYCGIDGCENIDTIYIVYFTENSYNALFV